MDFLMRLFVKDYDNTQDVAVRNKSGRAAGAIGIVTNFLLFAIKLLAGLLSGSVAMLADAVNNLTDSASSVIMMLGFKLAGKPADDKHPFGHARIEYISGIMISFIVLFLGFQLGMSSLSKIITPEEVNYSPLVYVILAVSILIKIWQCLFYKKVGRKIGSEAVAATSADSRNDVIATSAVLLGAVIKSIAGINLDGFMGLAVAAFIIVSGVKLVVDTANPLLGTAPAADMVRTIYEKVLSYEGVIGVHDLTVHNYGAGKCYASLHCEMPAEEDIMISHDIVDNIERDLLEEMGIQLVIHLDPVIVGDERANDLKQVIEQEIGAVYPEVTLHDFRVVWGITHSNIVFDLAVPFSMQETDSEIMNRITALVTAIDETYRLVVRIDRMSQTTFMA